MANPLSRPNQPTPDWIETTPHPALAPLTTAPQHEPEPTLFDALLVGTVTLLGLGLVVRAAAPLFQ